MKNISDKISTLERQTQIWRVNVWNKEEQWMQEERTYREGETILFIWQILFQKWDWHLFDICLNQ